MPNDLTAYERASLRLQAFGLLDDWGVIDEKGRHVPLTLARRKELADELVEWALSACSADDERGPGDG